MILQAPSGAVFGEPDLEAIRLMGKYRMVDYSDKPFTLKSGIKSNVYVRGRDDMTDHPELLWALGSHLNGYVLKNGLVSEDQKQLCLIGVPTAGTPLATATALVSHNQRVPYPICFRQMRSVLKSHGAHQDWVDGKPDLETHQYAAIENVITSGKSVYDAGKRMTLAGYPAKQMPVIILIDRQQGGFGRLQEAGFEELYVVFNLLDVTYAFGELGLWPKSAVQSVEDEIRYHKFHDFGPFE